MGHVNTSSVGREAAPHIPSLPHLPSLTGAGTASVLLTGLLASSAASCLLGIISSLFSAPESIFSGSPFSGSISLLLTGSFHVHLSAQADTQPRQAFSEKEEESIISWSVCHTTLGTHVQLLSHCVVVTHVWICLSP